MEESREQQKLHGFLRCAIYLSILLEAAVFIYHDAPFWGVFASPLDKIAHIFIYATPVYSKVATMVLICLVSIGTLAKKEKDRQQAQGMSDRITALTLTIQARAGEEDRLFGSVTNIDIEKALTAQGVTIDRRKIMLTEPIKQLGTYSVPVHLSSDVRGNITVNVVRES